MSSVIVTQNLRKSFPVGGRRRHKEIEILHGIDVRVEQGEFVGIFGPSGSGKSTLLHCMAGLTQASAGSVNMLGNELTSMGRSALSRLQREHVGFVFQSFCLIDSLNVADNVALPSRLLRRSLSTDAVESLLIEVGLGGRGKERIQSLSGGEQQRVAIARALSTDPDVIFADEPTGSLDSHNGAHVLGLLKKFSEKPKKAVVLVTHDLSAAKLVDRAVVIRDGLIGLEERHPTAEHLLELMEAKDA